jgi:phosphoribosylformylglycinamidine synthase
VRDFTGGTPATVDLRAEAGLQQFLVEAAKQKLLRSAHDCSTGGLAVALAEAAIGGPYAGGSLGAGVGLKGYGSAVDDVALLYGEDQGRVVVSCDPANEKQLVALAGEFGVPVFPAGAVGAPLAALVIATETARYKWSTESLREIYLTAIPRRMTHVDEDRASA